jgi:predicted DNA-binding transcriptional regulator YafY
MLYWILSFGADAEVLAPDAMRRAVADTARRMTDRYKSEQEPEAALAK